MLWRIALVATLAMWVGHPAVSQDQPPSSAEAKRIEALVNKAAAIVDAKGKAALSEFRQKASEWFSGELYVFAYSPDGTVLLNPAFPAREGRAYRREGQEGEGLPRRDYEDSARTRRWMGGLLVAQARAD